MKWGPIVQEGEHKYTMTATLDDEDIAALGGPQNVKRMLEKSSEEISRQVQGWREYFNYEMSVNGGFTGGARPGGPRSE